MASNDVGKSPNEKASQTYQSLEEHARTDNQKMTDSGDLSPLTNPGEPDLTVPKEVDVVASRNEDPGDQRQDICRQYVHHQCGHEDNLMDEEYTLHQPKQEVQGRKLMSEGSLEEEFLHGGDKDTLYRSHSGSVTSIYSSSLSSASSIFSQCATCSAAEKSIKCSSCIDFWNGIEKSKCCERIYRHFEDKLKEMFPKDLALQKRRVKKLLKALLEVNETTDAVKISRYLRLIRFIGPIRSEGNRCIALQQLEDLVKHSSITDPNRKSKVCWFAGPMSRGEASSKLDGKDPGTYMIRMSESEEDEGNFVLSLVMANKSVDHFRLEGHPETAIASTPFNLNLEFRGKRYSTLSKLVNNCLTIEPICGDDEQNAIVCQHVCEGLPFNDIIIGYK